MCCVYVETYTAQCRTHSHQLWLRQHTSTPTHTSTSTHQHTNTPTYLHTNTPVHQHTITQTHQYTNTPTHHYTTPAHQHTSTPTHQHTNTLAYQHTGTKTHQHTSTPAHQHTNTPTHQYTLKMEKKSVPETSQNLHTLTLLSARENCRHGRFKFIYIMTSFFTSQIFLFYYLFDHVYSSTASNYTQISV